MISPSPARLPTESSHNTINLQKVTSSPEKNAPPKIQEHYPLKPKVLIESDIKQLTFERFVFTEMSLFHAEINTVKKHLLSPESYIVEIQISEIPLFKVPKVYEEFRAFYRALKLRFPNVKWPEFPPAMQLMKKIETRKKAFNEILQHICEIARSEENYKRSILSIFFAFFVDSGKILKEKPKKQKESKKDKKLATKEEKLNKQQQQQRKSNENNSMTVATHNQSPNTERRASEDSPTIQINPSPTNNTNARKKMLSEDFTYPLRPNNDERMKLSKSAAFKIVLDNSATSLSDHEPDQEITFGDQTVSPFNGNSSAVLRNNKEDLSLAGYLTRVKKRSRSFDFQRILQQEAINEGLNDFFQYLALYDKENKSFQSNSNQVLRKRRVNSCRISKASQDPFFSLENLTKKNYIKSKTQAAGNFSPVSATIPRQENSSSASPQRRLTPSPQKEMISGKDDVVVAKSGNWYAQGKINSGREEQKTNEKNTSIISLKQCPVQPQPEEVIERKSSKEDLVQIRVRAQTSERIPEEKNQAAASKVSKEIDFTKEIIGFSGHIHAKLSSELQWFKYFARIIDCSLLLYQSVLDSFPIHVIPCYYSVVDYTKTPNRDMIELYHYYDAEKMQIVIDPENSPAAEQNNKTDPSKNLAVWHSQLKIASQKITGLQLQENYQPIGKLQLIITSATNIKNLPKNSTCYFRINHIPYTLKTSKTLSEDTIRWRQSFFIPICDTFFPLTLELICAYNNGWVKDNYTEEVICTSEIVVPDVLSLRANSTLTMDMNFKYTDQKKKQILKALNIGEQDLTDPIVRIKVKNLSSMKSYIAPAYGDYVEGVRMDTEKYSNQLLRLSLSRVKRVFSYVKIVSKGLDDIYHFKYPKFSVLCFLLFTWIIFMVDPSNVIADFLFVLSILCIYNHPTFYARIKPVLTQLFFMETDINTQFKKSKVIPQIDLTLKKNMLTSHWKFKLLAESSLMTRLKWAKKSLVILIVVLMKISAFFEKLKNVIVWDDPDRTALFLIFTVTGYCAFSVIPIRFVILLAIWMRFFRGIKYFKNLYIKNQEAAQIALDYILLKNFPDHRKAILENPKAPWPQNLNFTNFQKKMLEQFKQRLDITFPNDSLADYKTFEDLKEAVSTCAIPLKLKREPMDEARLHVSNPKEPKVKPKNILHFVMNVPSDYYRVIHPKMTGKSTEDNAKIDKSPERKKMKTD